MAKEILTDEFWGIVEPLIPKPPPRPKGGRPRVSDKAALRGILHVLATGLSWEYLPLEMGCGSGMTCWRRLRDWQEAGVWSELHAVMLDKLESARLIEWSRASVDSSSVAAPLAVKKGALSRLSEQTRPTAASSGASVTSP